MSFVPSPCKSQIGKDIDDSSAHCDHMVSNPVTGAKHGISDQLARAMKGDIASAGDADHFYPALFEHARRSEDVVRVGVAPKRDDRRMFEEKQSFAVLAAKHAVANLFLKFESPAVREPA